ncbi:MAG: hypothetical protein N2V75_06315 [Methanophagales archaeon]|nr:hypothetical protein [Methanophagales archaeon]
MSKDLAPSSSIAVKITAVNTVISRPIVANKYENIGEMVGEAHRR